MLKPILRGLLKICHILSGYNPSLCSSSANHVKRLVNICYIWYLHNCLQSGFHAYHSMEIAFLKVTYNHLTAKTIAIFSPSPCSEDNLPGPQKGSYHFFRERQTHFGFLDSVLFVYIPFWGTLCSGKCTRFEVRQVCDLGQSTCLPKVCFLPLGGGTWSLTSLNCEDQMKWCTESSTAFPQSWCSKKCLFHPFLLSMYSSDILGMDVDIPQVLPHVDSAFNTHYLCHLTHLNADFKI